MAWTPEQLTAINEEGKNIIVSAGAGSGKTAVLTERVIRKLKENTHINELLILTFTNAAAAEMKERIRSAINKTPGLEAEANLIDGAYITTFDAFSLAIVKKYHTKLNITNNIKVTDEVLINIETKKILDEIFDLNYLSYKQDFKKLIMDFCLKDDEELKKYILNTYKKISLKYDKESFLKNYISTYYTPENIRKFVDEYISLILSYKDSIKDLLTSFSLYFDGTYTSKVENYLELFFNATTYDELKLSLLGRFPSVPKDTPDEGKELKETLTGLLNKIKDLLIYENEEEIIKEIENTKENATVIFELLSKLDKRLTAYKAEHEMFNFTDIAFLAIKVVEENEDIRKELTNSFKEIMVDEYQDTSDT